MLISCSWNILLYWDIVWDIGDIMGMWIFHYTDVNRISLGYNGISWECNRILMEDSWNCDGILMGYYWNINGIAMEY